MAALGWALNLGFAGGTAPIAPVEFGDLTTLFSAYVDTLRDNSALALLDTSSLVMADYATARLEDETDLNTAYAIFLS